jgi:nitrate reductase gamma subunit
MRSDWQPLPADRILLVHLALVALLMIVFPVSKLLHAPGVFFSPTRNQVDNPREKRWTAGWSAESTTPKRQRGNGMATKSNTRARASTRSSR